MHLAAQKSRMGRRGGEDIRAGFWLEAEFGLFVKPILGYSTDFELVLPILYAYDA